MEFKNYDTVSDEIKHQIKQVCEIWIKYLGEHLCGVYLHGSMVLNCFCESISDIDLLIVATRKINHEERLNIAREIIAIDQKPCSLEMSCIYLEDIRPWKYPTPCQFHYSDYWTECYRKMLRGEIGEHFIVDTEFEDPDIASYVKLLNQCGVCVYGQPIKEVFPEVPEHDFWQSLSNDIDDYDFNAYNSKYFVSNILLLGRILSYKIEKRILSKYDGGLWSIDHVPEQYRYIVENALKVWYFGEEQIEYKQEDLDELREYLVHKIKEE